MIVTCFYDPIIGLQYYLRSYLKGDERAPEVPQRPGGTGLIVLPHMRTLGGHRFRQVRSVILQVLISSEPVVADRMVRLRVYPTKN